MTYDLRLRPGESWHTCIDVIPIVGSSRRAPLLACDSFGADPGKMPMDVESWLEQAPELVADWDALHHIYRRSLLDLAALRLRPRGQGLRWALPAGGLPWFMTVFGRDSIIAAYEALPFHAELARATLKALASLQATEWDDFADAQPGKIMHELRRGTLSALGEVPGVYYGTRDATMLFLILLDEYERWTGDRELVRELEPNARAALGWLEGPADLDADGYVEYLKRSDAPNALENHCWKDSDDSIRFADGRRPSRRSRRASTRATSTTPGCGSRASRGRSTTIPSSPTASSGTPRRSGAASTATSGSRGAATTRSRSIATSSRSTRSRRTSGTCSGAASWTSDGREQSCGAYCATTC